MIQSIQIGPFTIYRVLNRLLVFHVSCGGGPMPLANFEAEVCPWSEVERADEEKVRRFYAAHF